MRPLLYRVCSVFVGMAIRALKSELLDLSLLFSFSLPSSCCWRLSSSLEPTPEDGGARGIGDFKPPFRITGPPSDEIAGICLSEPASATPLSQVTALKGSGKKPLKVV
ncbi:hypothetical protein HPP92_017722 [Vanilla planifolia]|uniref:Uncharacterized protein n=1 Tax=Vanilla planifolia TaxID=51239 RepID=A0A835QBF3_VANPL|nr:hypothetical protein HPP92_017722 [Vanilla planifolia]